MWGGQWRLWKAAYQVQWCRCDVASLTLYARQVIWNMKDLWIQYTHFPRETSQPVWESLFGFHALTVRDTNSAFSGHGKKTCWAIFHSQPPLINGISRNGELAPIEQFVYVSYGSSTLSNVNQTRLHLFTSAKKYHEMVPPPRDALKLHILRANYQAKIWLQAD